MFTLKSKTKAIARTIENYQTEKAALFASLFLLAFGLGLIMDGKKLYNRQIKISQRVDYKSTLNPYTN
ncbi:MAG: hypothetical protein JST80_08220 [Bdellovibrionales bacterium]|nr:hypothetical protein [Bdellovibrionales bacterium]